MKKGLLVLLLVVIVGCAGMQAVDVFNSLAEKAGYACYTYLPEYRSATVSTCALKSIVQGTNDPLVVQTLIQEQIGKLWVASTENDQAFIALILNDLVRMTGLKTTTPTNEKVKDWMAMLDSFCGGIVLAQKTGR